MSQISEIATFSTIYQIWFSKGSFTLKARTSLSLVPIFYSRKELTSYASYYDIIQFKKVLEDIKEL